MVCRDGKVPYSTGSFFSLSVGLLEIKGLVGISKYKRILCLILQNGFWVMHLTVVRMIKFQFLAQFQMDHFPHTVVSTTNNNMSKKFSFYDTNKWYMYNAASILENDTNKLLWDFEIQTDHLISARRPDLKIINKKRELTKLWTLLSRLTTE